MNKSLIYLFLVTGAELTLFADPAWWSVDDYKLVDSNQTSNDSALVLQGQTKQAYYAAKEYFNDEFIQFGGAGVAVEDLFTSSIFTNTSNDFAPTLNGQLKYMASPFYLRLNELGIPLSMVGLSDLTTEVFPWSETTTDDVDMAPALIGQVKYVFSFDLSLSQDGDSIPDWWEYKFGLDPLSQVDNSITDADGDFRNDATEYAEKTDPNDYFDGSLPSLILVSGNGQTLISGGALAQPLVVRLENDVAIALENAPLNVSVNPIEGGTVSHGSELPNQTIDIRTDAEGEVEVYYESAAGFIGDLSIRFLAQTSDESVWLDALLHVIEAASNWSVFAGPYQTILYNGTEVVGTGVNDTRQLTDDANSYEVAFTSLSNLSTLSLSKIDFGADHAVAISETGEVYVWGDNFSGQLGTGDYVGRSSPSPISLSDAVIDLAAGDGFSVFVVSDGTGGTDVFLAGMLNGDSPMSVPTDLELVIGSPVSAVSAAGQHFVLLCEDGSVWAVGDNQLGAVDPTSMAREQVTPVRVIDSDVVKLFTSPDISLALTSTGELLGWGNQNFGQMGTLGPQSSGIVTIANNVAQFTAGNGFIAYVTSDNSLYTAGLNDFGQLGRDSGSFMRSEVTEVVLSSPNQIYHLTAGDRHFVYTTNTGSEAAWGAGDNRSGALGFGAVESATTPTQLNTNFQ